MSGTELSAFVGALLALLGGQAVWARYLLTKIQEARMAADDETTRLHKRLDEVKDTYVRREDLMEHIRRMERGQESLAAAVDRVHTRLDGLLGVEVQKGNGNKGRTQ